MRSNGSRWCGGRSVSRSVCANVTGSAVKAALIHHPGKRILQPQPDGQEIGADEILRLASVTIELHRKLCTGTPFPSAWLGGTLRAPVEGARAS